MIVLSAHAEDSFKRRSGRGDSTSGVRCLLPPKSVTNRLMSAAMRVFNCGSDSHVSYLLLALGNWTRSFLPSLSIMRHIGDVDRSLLATTRDLMSFFVVINVCWEFVSLGPSFDTGENSFGCPTIPSLGVCISLHKRCPGDSPWTDRSAAKFISSLEESYLCLDVVMAACAAVNFSESIREVIQLASRTSSLQIDLSREDCRLSPTTIASKLIEASRFDRASYLGILVAKNLEMLVDLSPELFIELSVLVFPVLRPVPLHRLILEGRVPRKNRLYAAYMLKLLESNSCGCLADGNSVYEFAIAIVDLSRVDAKAADGFLQSLETVLRRAAAAAADLLETGLLLQREGMHGLAALVFVSCLAYECSTEKCSRLEAALRLSLAHELEGGEQLGPLLEAYARRGLPQ